MWKMEMLTGHLYVMLMKLNMFEIYVYSIDCYMRIAIR